MDIKSMSFRLKCISFLLTSTSTILYWVDELICHILQSRRIDGYCPFTNAKKKKQYKNELERSATCKLSNILQRENIA